MTNGPDDGFADEALKDILKEIAVPRAVLAEARTRRDLVLEIAMAHEAARASYASGSVAHGTENKPLEDADCGVKINRRFDAFRRFGPDASGEGEGPEAFIQMFADFVLPQLWDGGYPNATVDLSGNRAIKFEFSEAVDIDDWGPVDPYVDLIVGLSRADGEGLWIPNRRENSWDPADPEHHTWLMTERDEKPTRVARAQLIRLSKRAIKRDGAGGGQQVVFSWNVSALALELVDSPLGLAAGLSAFLTGASRQISIALTEDPSPVVVDPIKLPEGVTNSVAARRLAEMAMIVDAARAAGSKQGARAHLAQLFGPELEAIRERDVASTRRAFKTGDAALIGGAVGLPGLKGTRSHGPA